MNIDFTDTLSFIISENNFDKDFFIIYDKKINKVLPYIPTDEEQKKSLLFQASSINIKDKNKYYVAHRSELPKELFYKEDFISHMVREATIQSIERNSETNEDELNLEILFKILKKTFKLSENQVETLYELSKNYTDNNILNYDDYLSAFDYKVDEDDDEFKKFQENIVYSFFRFGSYYNIKNVEENVRLAMIEQINSNKELIKNIINRKLDDVLKLIKLDNKLKKIPKI